MSSLTHPARLAPLAQSAHRDSRPGLLATVLRTLRLWAGRHRQRRQLAALDAHLLKDIGLTREQARAVADKPFWRE
ncbi:MAG: DUF1127 domain-containing protein [Rhodocyclaceae bacterium]|nr:DUF1127 domain-containing protein [Rhodocyclaceae bacterium]MCB1963304.1 DUF1127 domain-containing protein [Rhodocyclaceae bacterium]